MRRHRNTLLCFVLISACLVRTAAAMAAEVMVDLGTLGGGEAEDDSGLTGVHRVGRPQVQEVDEPTKEGGPPSLASQPRV